MASENSTIIGVFDRYGAAEEAASQLVTAGIPEQNIRIQSGLKTEAAGRTRDADQGDSEGGIGGFFHRLFGSDTPQQHVNHLESQYAGAISRGGALVCVTAPETDEDQVVEILNAAGAIDIDEGEDKGGTVSTERTSERQSTRATDRQTAIPVIDEELQVGKRVVRRGGVRVYSRVVEQPVEEQITLREERVQVERRPVDRPVTPADESRLRDQSFEVAETVEEPVISKQRRVKEEVVVGKQATQRQQTVRDTVRHTEVNVEPLAQEGGTEKYPDFRSDYDKNYASSGIQYSEVEPAYQYGYTIASDPEYQGKSWDQVESSLKTDYLRRSPNSTWDRVKGAVRYGWEKVTGQR